MISVFVRTILFWALISGQVLALPAADWLQKVGPALRELNYSGTMVHVADGKMETLKVFHFFKDGSERERLITLSGKPREVIRTSDGVVCVGTTDAQDKPVFYERDVSGSWSPALAISLIDEMGQYHAQVIGDGRVAGLKAKVISVLPRDRARYGHRLWLEVDTGFPLQVELTDVSGTALEKLAFLELELGIPPNVENLEPSLPQSVLASTEVGSFPEHSEQSAAPAWQVAKPPEGFSLKAARSRGEALQLLYSDGLASASVYVESIASNERGRSVTRRGAMLALAQWSDGVRVMAVGKLPEAGLEQFLKLSAATSGSK